MVPVPKALQRYLLRKPYTTDLLLDRLRLLLRASSRQPNLLVAN